MENVLAKEINHINNQEEINEIEISMYSKLIKRNKFVNDDEKIAKELYDNYQDTYLDKDLEFYKELGTKKLLNNIFTDLKEYGINYDCYTSEKAISQKYNLKEIIGKFRLFLFCL